MKKLFLSIVFLASCAMMRGGLVVSELMQSNVDCLMDDQHEFPDSWVEVYNTGNEAVDLSGYKLSPTRNHTDGKRMGQWMVPAHGYAVIYCDKQDDAQGLHMPFRLESGKGGAVYLFENLTLVDSVVGLVKQPAPNVSYGWSAPMSKSWGYQITPTPGAANSGIATGVLPEVVFDITGRVFPSTSTLNLTLSLPSGAPSGSVIRYTTNGSEPTASSPLYTKKITLTATTVVRAKLFCTGYACRRSNTETYVFLGRNMTIPVISISTDQRYFDDPTNGIYAGDNYQNNWRRPMHVELFTDPMQPAVINQLCEGRIQGGASRGAALKSMALYANKRFGTKRFNYEFFPDQRPGITDYKSISLRNAGNDFDYLYMRDAIIQRSVSKYVDIDWQAWRPAVVFINGQYRGMLNIRERANEDNIYSNYGGLEDICMIENGWNLQKGEWQTWEDFRQFMHTRGHSKAEYEAMIDTEEYLHIMVMDLFYSNMDFPGNNVEYWRPLTATAELPARWRLVAKDTEYALGLYGSQPNYNTMAWIYNADYDPDHNWANTYEHTRMFRYMMENAELRDAFIERAAVYMGDWLRYERIWPETWQPMYEMIQTEYPIHRKLFNEWWPNYQEELRNAQRWLQQRPRYFYQYIGEQYGLGSTSPMGVNLSLTAEEAALLDVKINGVGLSRGTFEGQYYQNRSIRLEATMREDNQRSEEARKLIVWGWNVQMLGTGNSATQQYQGEQCEVRMPSGCTGLIANVILAPATAIDETELQPSTESARKMLLNGQVVIEKNGQFFDLLGRPL